MPVRKIIFTCLLAFVFCGWPWQQSACAQADRRLRTDPALVLETGAPMGNCDALTFTPDGRFLLEAGDDKVVHIYPFDPKKGLDTRKFQTVRWSIWREERGAIYALALSPDKEASQVAIAGFGVRNGSVVVLDRATGKVLHALTEPKSGSESIWALAFSPSGGRVAFGTDKGGIWVWNLKCRRLNDVHLLGKHSDRGAGRLNYVRLVAFTAENQVLSVAEDGRALRWDIGQEGAGPEEVCTFKTPNLYCVALSPDHKWLAAGGMMWEVELRSLDGDEPKVIPLDEGDFPQSLAFDRAGQRLAVGVRTVPQKDTFFKETDDQVLLYDLTQDPPRPSLGPKPTFHAHRLAFHPRGDYLAVAGGNDHELTLWDLSRQRKVSEVRSPGSCLWSVALSENQRYLGFRDQRDTNPDSPNRRGKGPWRVFDLKQLGWSSKPEKFEPLAPREKAGGWTVKTVDPKSKSIYKWYVVEPGGTRYLLPLEPRDGLPRCFTFLEAEKGKPVRLVVGHYWGLSLFELGEQGPRLKRVFTGHAGEVMAVAASPDGKWLVSASTDQTIAAWSLADWPSQPELGAALRIDNGKLIVDRVDIGSPAWEAGLVEGDEVRQFIYAARFRYDSDRDRVTPEKCLEQLHRIVPDKECFFRVKRKGEDELVPIKTTVKQRPLWRFFPTRDREWVLWMWRNQYYAASRNGDQYVGWQVSSGTGDIDEKPVFYPLAKFSKRFYRPDAINLLVGTHDVEATLRGLDDTDPVSFETIEPPILQAKVDPPVVTKDCQVRWTADRRSRHPDQQVVQVEVWINDYRFFRWRLEDGQPMPKALQIPPSRLRPGPNEITLLGYNRAGARTEDRLRVTHEQERRKPDLYVFAVGISNYTKAAPRADEQPLPDLPATKIDALAMQTSWQRQRGKLYANVTVTVCTDQEATRDKILGELQALAKQVRPDDRLVLFLAGHGGRVGKSAGQKDRRERPDNPLARRGGRLDKVTGQSMYVFCCPDFDQQRLANTAISGEDLYEALAAIPCSKVLLLDACHSGQALPDPIRDLTPGTKGLTIIAACEPNEESLESKKLGHGLFTYALLEALDDRNGAFTKADRNDDGQLDAAELFAYLEMRLPKLLQEHHEENKQHPVCFPRELSPLPLASK
jgi:WD40 repeat protein/uncharacterized caspase-like protein